MGIDLNWKEKFNKLEKLIDDVYSKYYKLLEE